MVLDVSGSMGGLRFAGLIDAVDAFIAELDDSPQEERVSLTVYNSVDTKLVPLTRNLEAIKSGIRSRSPGGFTAIGRGLRTGINSVLNDPESRQFAFEISRLDDGWSTQPRPHARIGCPLCGRKRCQSIYDYVWGGRQPEFNAKCRGNRQRKTLPRGRQRRPVGSLSGNSPTTSSDSHRVTGPSSVLPVFINTVTMP